MIVRHALLLTVISSVSMQAQLQPKGDENTGDSVFADLNVELMFDAAEDDDAEQERLRWLMENPFDLNRVSRDELQTIPGVLPDDADAVLLLRRTIGRFVSVYQLCAIDSLNRLVDRLLPYVTVLERRSGGTAHLDIRTRMVTKVGDPEKPERPYLGSPATWYDRLSFSIQDVAGGVLFEKDPGERPSDGFISGFLQAQRVLGLIDVTIGDFIVECGQGLVLSSGTGFAKGGAGTGAVWRSGGGVRPYRSKDEFHFMRGIAASASMAARPGQLHLALFYSSRSLSGRQDSAGRITSLYDAGLFRTEAERLLTGAVQERVVGGRVGLGSWKGWIIGISGYHASFSHPLVSRGIFEFSGTSSSAASIDFMMGIGICTIFGEAAYSGTGSVSSLAGLIVNSMNTRMTLMIRNYSVGFHSLYANGFGENGAGRNERGLYLNLQIRPARILTVAAYLDLFMFPWRTYRNPLPSSGFDSYLQTDIRFSGEVMLSLRYTRKEGEQVLNVGDDDGRSVSRVVGQKRERGRITLVTCPVSGVRLRSRAEMVDVSFGPERSPERGMLLYQDLAVIFSRKVELHCRLTFFETASYDSRVYEYENDVRGGYANPALFGRGKRWYLLAVFHPFKQFELSAKYTVTQKVERNHLLPSEQSFIVQLDLHF